MHRQLRKLNALKDARHFLSNETITMSREHIVLNGKQLGGKRTAEDANMGHQTLKMFVPSASLILRGSIADCGINYHLHTIFRHVQI